MSEADEQATVVHHCRARRIPVYHILNEGKRSSRTGAFLKRQGLSPGVPDLCIPVARGHYHSLYIEMKAKGGRITAAQKEWTSMLRAQGMCAAVCYGADDAISLTELWVVVFGLKTALCSFELPVEKRTVL